MGWCRVYGCAAVPEVFEVCDVLVEGSVLVAAVGLPVGFHFHDLRHTGNQLTAASGATTRELMHRMGHGSMRAALIYQHATSARDRSIATALSALVAADRPARGADPGGA